jgi:hypothetical protein
LKIDAYAIVARLLTALVLGMVASIMASLGLGVPWRYSLLIPLVLAILVVVFGDSMVEGLLKFMGNFPWP